MVKQYEDDETGEFMMLPTDMALKEELYFLNMSRCMLMIKICFSKILLKHFQIDFKWYQISC